jgi:hypothetical protein
VQPSGAEPAGRIRVRTESDSVRIEIAPPIAEPRLRRRLGVAAVILVAGALTALLRLSQEWQRAVRGSGSGLGAFWLLLLSLCVVFGAPLAAWGLTSLLFAEETLEVRAGGVFQEIRIFGEPKRRAVPRPASLRWTTRPVAPWWTWTFVRLALSGEAQRFGVGATLGVSEKRRLAEILRNSIA